MSEKLLQRSRQRRHLRPAFARALRQEAAVTLAEVGEALNVSEGTVSRWETGARRPRGAAAERYARLLARLEAELRMTRAASDAPPAAVIEALARVLARVLVDAIRREDEARTNDRPSAPNSAK